MTHSKTPWAVKDINPHNITIFSDSIKVCEVVISGKHTSEMKHNANLILLSVNKHNHLISLIERSLDEIRAFGDGDKETKKLIDELQKALK